MDFAKLINEVLAEPTTNFLAAVAVSLVLVPISIVSTRFWSNHSRTRFRKYALTTIKDIALPLHASRIGTSPFLAGLYLFAAMASWTGGFFFLSYFTSARGSDASMSAAVSDLAFAIFGSFLMFRGLIQFRRRCSHALDPVSGLYALEKRVRKAMARSVISETDGAQILALIENVRNAVPVDADHLPLDDLYCDLAERFGLERMRRRRAQSPASRSQ